jgi:hypothetical protein
LITERPSGVAVVVERPTLPAWIERELLKLGGKTDAGEPIYRIIWGAANIFRDGEPESRYDPTRWHLEKWVAGRYEHAYKFGTCPHMKRGETQWCKACFISGGEYLDVQTHFKVVERVMREFVLTEQLQKSSIDKGAKMERDALFERERKREEEAGKAFSDALLGNLSAIDRVPHSLSSRGSKTVREVDMPLHAGQVKHEGRRMPKPNQVKQI